MSAVKSLKVGVFFKMFKSLLLLLVFMFCKGGVFAQSPNSLNSSEILSQIKKLNELGSVLYIAAHPDDENTKLLAYLSKEKLYKTGYLSLTRGDGGQNLIGDEQGVDLGLIRTQELLAARRIDGAEQYFSSAYDFGYSKNPEETFSIWNHNKILGDVVWIIRNFKPDVIICRFPSTGEGGHGHHTASAILAQEAFEAAGDSTRFSDQLTSGIVSWKAKRLLWNTFNFGTVNTQKDDQFKLDIGGYNALAGKSYGELAALSRSQHKSQGFGVPAQRGSSIEYFATIKGEAPVNSLLDGVASSWSGIGYLQIQRLIDSIIIHYDPFHPQKSVQGLLNLYDVMYTKVHDIPIRKRKLEEIKNLILACGGVFFEAVSSSKYITNNDSVKITFIVNNRLGIPLENIKVNLFDNNILSIDSCKYNNTIQISKSLLIPKWVKVSQPYWLREKMSAGSFETQNKYDLLKSENEPAIEFSVDFKLKGDLIIKIKKPLVYKNTDPVNGEKYQPVSIVPSLIIHPEKSLLINSIKSVSVKVTANRDIEISSIKLNNNLLNMVYPIHFKKFENKIIELPLVQGENSIDYFENENLFNQDMHEIHYDHIPDIVLFKPSLIQYRKIDLKISGKKIGYIIGAGDKVKESLSQMGYQVDILTQKDITKESLKKYDAIITGVRAYNTNEWMNEVYEVLMNYIEEGGVLLVQYNTSNQIGPIKAKIGPYPFNISRNRVTDEKATIELVNPNSSIFNFPNKIVEADFNDWVQERSIYHASDIDSHYERPLLMSDSGENKNEGSLIIANYGKGKFIYTGISFFRQLPVGVSGAYRLFANLISK